MISFFANKNGSGEIRGRQMADHLGGRLNPTEGYEDDVCIYVKRKPPDNYPKRSYLDILDGSARVHWLKEHKDIGVIASSLSAKTYLEEELGREVIYIPQHHCNIERVPHTKQWPFRLGVVGGPGAIPKDLAELLGVKRSHPLTRQGVIDAYLEMDVQIIWRDLNGLRQRPLKNALKIVNAASFGIPTIALPEPGYDDVRDYYIPAHTMRQVADVLRDLAQGGYGAIWNEERLLYLAEEYHIDNIAKRYAEL
jgi:hypothetical protein